MRTRVIPAQITTVEDKIAGNLNITQMSLLVTPVILGTAGYALMPPAMKFVWYKLVIFLISFAICVILSLRVKGKVVLNWLMVLVKYQLRPKYYVFDKNDQYLRTLYLPKEDRKKAKLFNKRITKSSRKKPVPAFGVAELIRLEELIKNQKLNLRYKRGRKGGLDVALEKVSKKG